jgi:hypothetical protein
MHFGTKSYLKSNRNHTAKQTLVLVLWLTLEPLNWRKYTKIRPDCFSRNQEACEPVLPQRGTHLL